MEFKISVIIPIYGVENYIERCAESLMRQTFKEVEYIFVNDCTNDASMEVLQKVISKYPNVICRIVNKERNEGLPLARKTGLELSSGKYIYHMDSDDWLDENALEEMYAAITKDNADILCCGFVKEYPNYSEVCLGERVTSPADGIDMMLHSEKYLHSGVWAKLVRKELFKYVKFPPSYMHEDLVLMVQVFHYAKTVAYLPKAFYHYLQSNVSSMTNLNKAVRNKSAAINFHFLVDFMIQTGIEQRHRKELMYRINSFKTYSLDNGRLLDETLYPLSNRYIMSLNAVSNFWPKFYTMCAAHKFPYLWIAIRIFKDILKLIIRKR